MHEKKFQRKLGFPANGIARDLSPGLDQVCLKSEIVSNATEVIHWLAVSVVAHDGLQSLSRGPSLLRPSGICHVSMVVFTHDELIATSFEFSSVFALLIPVLPSLFTLTFNDLFIRILGLWWVATLE